MSYLAKVEVIRLKEINAELLEALKEFVDRRSQLNADEEFLCEWAAQAHAAIAKATGESE